MKKHLIFGFILSIFLVMGISDPNCYASPPPKIICELFLAGDASSQDPLEFLQEIAAENKDNMLLIVYGDGRVRNSIFSQQKAKLIGMDTPLIIFNGNRLIKPSATGLWLQQCRETIKELSLPAPAEVEFALSTRLSKSGKPEVVSYACNLDASEGFKGKVVLWELRTETSGLSTTSNFWINVNQLTVQGVNLSPFAITESCPLPAWVSIQQDSAGQQWQVVGLLEDEMGNIKGIDWVSAADIAGWSQ